MTTEIKVPTPFWLDHEQVTEEGINRTMGITVATEADLPGAEILVYFNQGTTGERTRMVTTSGMYATVSETGDVWQMQDDGTWDIIRELPRYLAPTTVTEYGNAHTLGTNQDVDAVIGKNVHQLGHAWIPAVISAPLRAEGKVAYRFIVTDTSAVSCHLSGNTGNNTVKLMVKLSPNKEFDIVESGTFEDNGYTAVHTLVADSGTNLTNRRSFFGNATNLAYYFDQAAKNQHYLHFAWYLEKIDGAGSVTFGQESPLTDTHYVKDTALSNSLVSATLQRDRTVLEIGWSLNNVLDENKVYMLVVPEQGSTFNSSSPNTNTDYMLFRGSDVSTSTLVSSPLVSKWTVDVANVMSDLNLPDIGGESSWSAGEIRSADDFSTTATGFELDGVEVEVKISGRI